MKPETYRKKFKTLTKTELVAIINETMGDEILYYEVVSKYPHSTMSIRSMVNGPRKGVRQ